MINRLLDLGLSIGERIETKKKIRMYDKQFEAQFENDN